MCGVSFFSDKNGHEISRTPITTQEQLLRAEQVQQRESYRALSQAMQCETLDECKDGPSREEQSKQHSSADVPPQGPPKREAALAGAHKSPTKSDGVVHKKTRATYPP